MIKLEHDVDTDDGLECIRQCSILARRRIELTVHYISSNRVAQATETFEKSAGPDRGTLKMRDWKMRDWNYWHQTAGTENAGLDLAAPYSRWWKMRDWKIREQKTYGTPRVA